MDARQQNRRSFLRASAAFAGAGLLQACGSTQQPSVPTTSSPKIIKQSTNNNLNSMRIFACSGFGESTSRSELAVQRLTVAGFAVSNQQASVRRYQRFAGSDAERAADLQEVAVGRVPVPKVLMGLRGGYGAMRILPLVNWSALGARMREQGTLLFGYSDVTAVQLALLAQGQMCSFAGPMLYSEFGKPQMSEFTTRSFIDNSCNAAMSVTVAAMQNYQVQAEGILWGGNLSVLSALVGSPYMPQVDGGILFIEDVGEQPYRIERMLQTLYLSGILGRQQAIVLGSFRMGSIRDVYDSSYTFNSVVQTMARLAKVPVLTGFPFGHVADKVTFPLGARASLHSTSDGGYQIDFRDYPVLNASVLALNTLIPQPPAVEGLLNGIVGAPANETPSSETEDAM
ncbi:LD-carboxypeptidase [Snodgrassella alvi]|jgi:muramoyltetrapeptide carboxypeptidase|uniref:LD-carboxypeptidase n=1 Tax=Snodgrassella alvi TaxID=1196083 RepID=A0A855FM05_9NEIS|nr:LD-carboxypeptidase [Snodgrassella alvi]PIT58495.1 LD-carboxypeptidase [Snodgrassella alvi]